MPKPKPIKTGIETLDKWLLMLWKKHDRKAMLLRQELRLSGQMNRILKRRRKSST
jgi:hypothetical protein